MSGHTRIVHPGSPLTDREREILPLLAEGLTDQQIGTRLYLAFDTVKTHNRHLFHRLGARNRAHAVAIGYQRGLLGNLEG